jgi:SOS-response transcriptional repressor LexA
MVTGYPDMKGKYPNGLQRAMNAKGVGPTALAAAIGTSKQNVARWAAQERKLPMEWAEKIARYLDVFLTSLLVPQAGPLGAPLISWVSAGALKAPSVVIELDDAKMAYIHGLDPKGDWIALEVEGDSMDRISPPESIIFVNRKDRRLVTNACYVIADAEGGEATYKRFRANPDRWEPVSTNPEHEPVFVRKGREPVIIGRVRKTLLSM